MKADARAISASMVKAVASPGSLQVEATSREPEMQAIFRAVSAEH